MTDPGAARLHDDAAFFRSALSYTAAEIEFLDVLVEKDYFCSMALQALAASPGALVFKGGTSLAKIHLGAYRISEVLDFSVSIPESATRKERSRAVEDMRRGIDRIVDQTGLKVARPFQGSNENRQYFTRLAYDSRIDGARREIKVEVGAREPLLQKPFDGEVMTLIRDPIDGRTLLPKFTFPCLSWEEAMAEKFRAAMTRVAIRDFFDIKFATRNMLLKPLEPEFLDLLRKKLAIGGTSPIDLSEQKKGTLRRQLESDLRPVLRPVDFGIFDLNETYERVREVAGAIA